MLWFTAQIEWDIAIAPLEDTAFTQSKSDIKFLDYCAVGSAGLYSEAGAYNASVRHGETGWLVKNRIGDWADALEYLISNRTQREKLAIAGNQYLFTNRILAQCFSIWQAGIEAVDGH
jgi:hypothetical protein